MRCNPCRLPAWLLAGALGVFALAASASAQQGASMAYEEAVVRFEQGDLPGSLLELKKALTANANLLSGHILLARVYLAIGEGAAAEDALLHAIRLGADPALTWPLRASALLMQYKFQELVKLAPESGLPQDVQSVVLVRRGDAFLGLNDVDSAERSYQRALELAPQASAPRVALARLALRRQDVFSAEAGSLAAVRLAPDDADAWSTHGTALHARGDLSGALDAYRRSIELEPDHYEARIARLGILVDTGRRVEVEEDIEHLRERFPLDARTAYLESVHLAKTGRRGEAREAVKRAAALLNETPAAVIDNSPQLELLAGIANYETGAFEQAGRFLERFIERFPEHVGARKIMGAIMVAQQRGDEAIQMLETALQIGGADARLLEILSEAYVLKGRHDVATRYLEKSLELGGGSASVRTRLAISRIASGDEQAGLEELSALFEQDPSGHARAGITLAVAYLQRGRSAEALSVAESLSTVDPDNLTILNLLASAQLANGSRGEANRTYQRILAQDPAFLTARINLAASALNAGNLAKARERLEAILDDHPSSVRSMVLLARAHERGGQLAAAVRWARKAAETDPQDVKAAIALVDMHLQMGDGAEALRAAEAADIASPDTPDVLAALGRAQIAMERPDMALATYNRMVRVAGFDADALRRVALLQLGINDDAGAIYSLTKALQGDPSHLPSRQLRIEAQLRLGSGGDALVDAQGLVKDYPDMPEAYRLLGDAERALGRYDVAIASYRKAFELDASSANLLRLYDAQVRVGEIDDARGSIVGWLESNPDDADARLALAEFFLARGQLDEAREQYEALSQTYPDAPGVLNNLAYILDLQGDAGALAMARRAQQAAPGDPLVADTLGWMLVRAGRAGEALEYLRDAQSRAAGNPEILFHLAAALASLDRREEALRELRRAIAYGMEFEGLADAQALLDRLEGTQGNES